MNGTVDTRSPASERDFTNRANTRIGSSPSSRVWVRIPAGHFQYRTATNTSAESVSEVTNEDALTAHRNPWNAPKSKSTPTEGHAQRR